MIYYRQLIAGIAVVCLLAGLPTKSLAQRRPNTHFLPYSSVTFGVGTSTYLGELNAYSVSVEIHIYAAPLECRTRLYPPVYA